VYTVHVLEVQLGTIVPYTNGMSFGKWYEEKKAEESNDIESGRESWLGEDVPLFNSETMQNFSWDNLKSSMEAQFPKKIMGMGYQQRFQVSERTKKQCSVTHVGNLTGFLWSPHHFGSVLCAGFLCWITNAGVSPS